MPGLIPDASWLGRVFETAAHLGVEEGFWAAVTMLGDKSEHDPEDSPLRGLRLTIFDSEQGARVAAARALKEANGATAISPVQRKYALKRHSDEHAQLRAVSAKDAGKLGGNKSVARLYWDNVDAREGRSRRDTTSAERSPAAATPTASPAAAAPTAPPPAAAASAARTPPSSPQATPRDRGDERRWPQWCVDAGGERAEFSLRKVDLGEAFGGRAVVGGCVSTSTGEAYHVKLDDGTILQPLPAQIIECALVAEKYTTKEWLIAGSGRGGAVDVTPFPALSTAVLGPMLKKHTPGKYIVSAAALRELAQALSVNTSDMKLPAHDKDLSKSDGSKLAVATEYKLMRLFKGRDLEDVTETATSPSPLRKSMRKRATERDLTPTSIDSNAAERTPAERSGKARKSVSFAPSVTLESDEDDESITQRLTRALTDDQWVLFAADAVALMRIDIDNALMHRSRYTHIYAYA